MYMVSLVCTTMLKDDKEVVKDTAPPRNARTGNNNLHTNLFSFTV